MGPTPSAALSHVKEERVKSSKCFFTGWHQSTQNTTDRASGCTYHPAYFCSRTRHLPWFLHSSVPSPGGSREPKVPFSMSTDSTWTSAQRTGSGFCPPRGLGLDFAHREVRTVPGPTLWLPLTGPRGGSAGQSPPRELLRAEFGARRASTLISCGCCS